MYSLRQRSLQAVFQALCQCSQLIKMDRCCFSTGALLVACSHDSIPDELLLHQEQPELSTPASPDTPTGQTPGEDTSGRPQLGRMASQSWEMGPHGISKLSPGHNLSRLSPGQRLSRLSPLRYALSQAESAVMSGSDRSNPLWVHCEV